MPRILQIETIPQHQKQQRADQYESAQIPSIQNISPRTQLLSSSTGSQHQ